jgi:hypothetical protein
LLQKYSKPVSETAQDLIVLELYREDLDFRSPASA